MPPQHQHVLLIPYFPDPQSVWNVIANYSQLFTNIPDDPHRLYGVRMSNDTMNFSPYARPQKQYHKYLTFYLDSWGLAFSRAADSARFRMIRFLRDEWTFGMPRGSKGLANVVAQTRIASSYGLLQPMYTTALNKGYLEDEEHSPEFLNITDTTMRVSMVFQKQALMTRVGANPEAQSHWEEGFENALTLGVYPKWNTKKNYPLAVIRNSTSFLPKP